MDLTTRGEVIGLRLLLNLKSRTSSEGERKQPRKRTEMNVRKDIYIYIFDIFELFALRLVKNNALIFRGRGRNFRKGREKSELTFFFRLILIKSLFITRTFHLAKMQIDTEIFGPRSIGPPPFPFFQNRACNFRV